MRKRSEAGGAKATAAGEQAETPRSGTGAKVVVCKECACRMTTAAAQSTDPPSCIRCGAELEVEGPTTEPEATTKPATPQAKAAAKEAVEGRDQSAEQALANADLALEKNREHKRDPKEPHPQTGLRDSENLVEKHARKPDPQDVGEEVSYTWGEEMFRFGDFSNTKVGPFMGTTRIREGETRAHAIARLQREVDGQAKIARDAKLDDYTKALLGVKSRVEKAGR